MKTRKKYQMLLASLVLLIAGASSLCPSASQARAAEDSAVIEGFPSVSQWYSLDCEYAAAAAVTLYWGNVVSQRDFIREVQASPNPHIGFRGAFNGAGGGVDDYGVYAEALAPVLENHGYNAVTFYGGVSRLKANVAAGNPVVVWITVGKYVERPVYHASFQGSNFKLVPGEHTLVVYGYDSGGVNLMDVGDGGFYYTDWDSFLRRWGYFDDMGLIIFPQ